jgi:hypothetical protein
MLQNRLVVMSSQRQRDPSSSIDGSMRIPVIQQRVFERHATLHFVGGRTINLLLCLSGLGYLLYSTWHSSQKPTSSSASLVMLLVAFTSATPALFTPLDWDRYYLLPVVFSTAFIAVGIGWPVSGILARLRPK